MLEKKCFFGDSPIESFLETPCHKTIFAKCNVSTQFFKLLKQYQYIESARRCLTSGLLSLSNQPVSNDKPNFSLRRHKREKSDTGSDHHRSKTLNNNFKYQSLGKHSGSNKRPLSGIKIDHITLDGGGEAGATLVKSKEEALESVCSNSTLSPRSVKRISLGTNLSVLYDTEPLLLHHDSATNKGSNHVGFVEIEEDGRSRRSKRRTSLLCCCPRRRRRNSL